MRWPVGCDNLLAVMSVVVGRDEGALVAPAEATKVADLGRRAMPWLPFCLIAVIGVVRLGVRMGDPFTSGGDVAFLELQLRQTLHGVVSVGPYSRFGWHDPGPAMFYLFAPLYWLTGGSSRSLFLSSWLLNIGSALVAVVLVRRRAGTMAGWVTAFVLLLFVTMAGFDRLIDPWNPSILAVPMLLVAVSAAAAFDGDLWGLVTLTASATFVIQTYIATIPVAALFWLIGVSGYLWSWYRTRSVRQDSRGAVTGRVRASRAGMIGLASLVAATWALPIAQQLHERPGNLGLLLKFELHPPPTAGVRHHSLHQAIAVVSDYSTSLGLGEPSDIAAHSARIALACLYAVLGVAAALWWANRGGRFLAALAAATPIGLFITVAAATRVTGPIYSYMFWWSRMLPIPTLIAFGAAAGRLILTALPARPRFGRLSVGAGTIVMTAAAGPALGTAITSPAVSYPDSPGARLVAHQIEAAVGSRDQVFTVQIAVQGVSDGPLILTLAKNGYRFHLTPEMDLYEGDTHLPTEGPTFMISHGNSPTPTAVRGPTPGRP